MKKFHSLAETKFMKDLFLVITAVFLVAAVCMPDRSTMFTGLLKILVSPSKSATSYFAVGGFAATFLNMGLVAASCLILYLATKATLNNVSFLAFILTTSFGAWGINIVNMWPPVLGVVLHAIIRKEKMGTMVNTMLFGTGLAPLFSDLMIRYPHVEVVGFNIPGVVLTLVLGCAVGYLLPAGLAYSPKVHKGYALYSAALPVGMMAFFLTAALYNTVGLPVPGAMDTLGVTSRVICNVFYCCLFGGCVIVAMLMGCRFRTYWRLLTHHDVHDFSSYYGNAVFLMNMGMFGLFVLGYYNLIGAPFNGVTFGIILCMVSICDSGASPANVWPTMLGYVVASFIFGGISKLVGGEFTMTIHSQAIVVGLCYASGMCPISDHYGWQYGFLAAIMHYVLVSSVPVLHGGFCLYNGGFTATMICLILIPKLEWFAKTKEERRHHKHQKKLQKAGQNQ